MELTIREKEVLNVFGCMNYEATMKRLAEHCIISLAEISDNV